MNDTGHRRVPMAENRKTRQTRHVVRWFSVRNAALPIFDRIPCLETPETRIRNRVNAILPKSPHGRARPPCFSLVSVRLISVHCPASFFRAGIAILARKVTMAFRAKLEMIRARARCAFWPACGRVLGHGRLLQFPTVFTVTQRPDWSAFNVSTAAPAGPIRMLQFPGPNATSWDFVRQTPSCCVKRCTGLAPQFPPGLAPPVTGRQGRCAWMALEF